MSEDVQNVLNPAGELVSIPLAQVKSALAQGYSQATPEDVSNYQRAEKYGTTGQQIITGLEGAGEGATLGLSTAIERGLGVNPKDIRERREENPISHGLGQVAGIAATSFIPGAAEAEAAELGARAINPLSAQSIMSGLGEKAATSMGLVPGGIASTATKYAVENAIFQSGDEVSKMFSSDPNQSIETAVANVGLAGIFGAGIGGTVGAISPLWKATQASKVGEYFSDFKNRIKEHLDNPDRVGSLADELVHRVNTSDEIFDEAYGPKGIKAEAISKLLPTQLTDHMVGMAEDTIQASKNFIKEMRADPDLYPRGMAAKFEKETSILSESLSELQSPEQVFNALQRFKQALQEQAPKRWEQVPLEAKDYLRSAGSISKELKVGLEDPEVWGKAGEVQQDINKAFREWLPFKKQFQGKFMSKIGEEHQIDMGKLQTFINQTGKAAQETKQKILGGFLKGDQAYREAIERAYEKIGQESPFTEAPLNYSNAELQKLTPGQKLADAFTKRGLTNIASEGLGAGTGAIVGGAVGHPYLGAIIGEHALRPFFNSILPSLVKPLLEQEASGAAVKSAIETALATMRGENMIGKASKAVFKAGQEVVPSTIISEREKEKLEERLTELRDNPTALMNSNGDMGHYLPGHAAAMGQTAMNAVNILNQARPATKQAAPLDDPIKPSKADEKAYLRNLTIAQMPLVTLHHVKNGTLLPSDVAMLKGLYPRLHQKLSNQLVGEMLNHKAKGEAIPYKTRQGLSLFLGQPLDSTLTPQSIQLNQQRASAPLPSEVQQQKPMRKMSDSGAKSFSSMAMTSGQRAEANRLK